MEWSLEFDDRVPQSTRRLAAKLAAKPGSFRDIAYSYFRAGIETTLAWKDIEPVLDGYFREASYEIGTRAEGSLTAVRRKAIGGRIDQAAARLDLALREGRLEIRLRLAKGGGIGQRAAGPLVTLFEGLEEALHDREDLRIRQGRIGAGAAELLDTDHEVLVPSRIDLPFRADPIAARPRLALFFGILALAILSLVLLRPVDTTLALLSGLGLLALAFAYVGYHERRLPIGVTLESSRLVLRYRGRHEEIPWANVVSVETVPGEAYDYRLVTNVGNVRRKSLLGYLPAYRIQQAKAAMESVARLEDWMLPDWREAKEGMAAGLPNRTGALQEYRNLGTRAYVLKDPLRTLLLVPQEEDRRILVVAAEDAWDRPDRLERLFRTALIEEYVEEAARLGRRLLELGPCEPFVMKGTFAALLHLKRPDEAEALVRRLIGERDPTTDEHLALSRISYNRGRIEDALYQIGRAVELDPNNLDALRAWISVVSAESGKAQALSELDYVATKQPETWGPYCALGEFLFAAGDFEEAEAYLKRAMEREPAQEVVTALSALYGNLNRLRDLVDLVEGARARGGAGTAALLNLAKAYMDLGSWQKARGCLDAAKERAEPEWLPVIFDLRQNLSARGLA